MALRSVPLSPSAHTPNPVPASHWSCRVQTHFFRRLTGYVEFCLGVAVATEQGAAGSQPTLMGVDGGAVSLQGVLPVLLYLAAGGPAVGTTAAQQAEVSTSPALHLNPRCPVTACTRAYATHTHCCRAPLPNPPCPLPCLPSSTVLLSPPPTTCLRFPTTCLRFQRLFLGVDTAMIAGARMVQPGGRTFRRPPR